MNTLLEENKSLKKEIKSVKSEKTSFDLDLFEEVRYLPESFLIVFLFVDSTVVICHDFLRLIDGNIRSII